MTKYKRPKSVGSFTVERNVGKGSFGSIFKVKREEDGQHFAMKVSPKEKKTNLSTEHEFLGQLQGSPYFPQLIGYGDANEDGYLIMELLGPSLDDILEISPRKGLTMSTSLRVGIEMLRAIRAFHEKGFVHRDIKPSNFLVRPSRKYPIVLIDYGVSRKIIDEQTKKMVTPRVFIGFVGTMKYASITAHEGKELSFCDDMFSWFVSLLEIMVGKVPWRTKRVHKDMIFLKKYCDMETFCSKLPRQLISIYHLILNMKYNDIPNYDLIIAFLVEAMKENNCSWSDKYDWETFSERRLKKVTNISIVSDSNEEPLVPTNLPSTDIEIPYTKPQLPQIEDEIDDSLQVPKNRCSKSVGPLSRCDTTDASNFTPKYVDTSSSTSSLSSSITPFSSYSYSLSSSSSSSLDSDSSESLKKQTPSTPQPQKPAPLVVVEDSLLQKVEPAKNNVPKKKLFNVHRKKHAGKKHNTLSIEQVPTDIVVHNEEGNSTPIERVALPETVNELEKNLNGSKIAEDEPKQDDVVQKENSTEEKKEAEEMKQEEKEEDRIIQNEPNEPKDPKQGVEDPDVGCQCRI